MIPRGSVVCCARPASPPSDVTAMETDGDVPPVSPDPLPVIPTCTAPALEPAKRTIHAEPVGLATRALPLPMLDKACSADCTVAPLALYAIFDVVCPLKVSVKV